MPGSNRRSPAALGPLPDALRGLCAWLDQLPLSRPKRHLTRDFSDGGAGGAAEAGRGVLVAEIVKHFHPRLVDLHSYIPACNTDQKLSNWSLLNRKVFRKLCFCVSEEDIRKVVANVPGAIEPILCALREKVEANPAQAGSPGTALHVCKLDPGFSSMDAVHSQAGLLSPSAPTSMKTLQKQRALEKKGSCACECQDPAEGAWEHLAKVRQLLEDKEQALDILQETVQILQMKVIKLEHLVQLKDLQIAELMRLGTEECHVPPGAPS
ncbi:sperm flagellar protein 1-like isoform X1 [Marmota marmota marmota]|uniref:sperm flagellar protein 1-like isoform X1 n=1 Tax=Marmota marmota marmota TaxID=9994 RepID=UPI002093647B|nr:sperm flagellar protein 1-like isoform X1 [Marmota marmota marmota]